MGRNGQGVFSGGGGGGRGIKGKGIKRKITPHPNNNNNNWVTWGPFLGGGRGEEGCRGGGRRKEIAPPRDPHVTLVAPPPPTLTPHHVIPHMTFPTCDPPRDFLTCPPYVTCPFMTPAATPPS